MPYAINTVGVYTLVNHQTKQCYVGQSQRAEKRIREHFRLLRLNKHTNPRLQHAYNKYGANSFVSQIEVECEDTEDIDAIEEAFISGAASFSYPTSYNISAFAKAPMRGKAHDAATRERISAGRKKTQFDYKSVEHRARLVEAQKARLLANPKFVADLKFILDNPDMSYAARGRVIGVDTCSVRKKALRYQHLKGVI